MLTYDLFPRREFTLIKHFLKGNLFEKPDEVHLASSVGDDEISNEENSPPENQTNSFHIFILLSI